jgi:hypothetical protein
MAHFAKLNDDNVVLQVVVVSNSELLVDGAESESKGVAFCNSLFGGRWIQTSYSGSIRKQFCGVGYCYDESADVFVAPQPYPSWTLDANHDWQPPTQRPAGRYFWNESTLSWDELPGS